MVGGSVGVALGLAQRHGSSEVGSSCSSRQRSLSMATRLHSAASYMAWMVFPRRRRVGHLDGDEEFTFVGWCNEEDLDLSWKLHFNIFTVPILKLFGLDFSTRVQFDERFVLQNC